MSVVNATEEIAWEVMDQVESLKRMVAWLVSNAGGDPAMIGFVPRDTEPEGIKAA